MTDWIARFTGALLEASSPWLPSLVVPDGDPGAPDYLELHLLELPAEPFARRGIYGSSKDRLPERFRHVHPDLHSALVTLEVGYPACFYYSDVRRSASESEAAVKAGRGALRAGYSTHNFGAAVDLDVDRTRDRLRAAGVVEMGQNGWKRELDEMMRAQGLWCYRRDHQRGSEDWHFNLGADHGYEAGQAWIDRAYGAWWRHRMTPEHTQRALAKLGLYQGAIDGDHGRLTRAALKVFQRAWRLPQLGIADMRTRRVLAFMTAVAVP